MHWGGGVSSAQPTPLTVGEPSVDVLLMATVWQQRPGAGVLCVCVCVCVFVLWGPAPSHTVEAWSRLASVLISQAPGLHCVFFSPLSCGQGGVLPAGCALLLMDHWITAETGSRTCRVLPVGNFPALRSPW
uniref:Uncharacterized protein n=1 Tax=Myotis myotis TaxID=51298 RepID=A0A7J8AMK3_MYOMY|nr:hypothetical protein mMyoMyo1_007971 [Myotis myotis]